MRRFFFDTRNGDKVTADEEGMEFATLDAVQDEAVCALADMARDDVRASSVKGLAHDVAIEVRDHDGPVMRAKFSFEVERLQ